MGEKASPPISSCTRHHGSNPGRLKLLCEIRRSTRIPPNPIGWGEFQAHDLPASHWTIALWKSSHGTQFILEWMVSQVRWGHTWNQERAKDRWWHPYLCINWTGAVTHSPRSVGTVQKTQDHNLRQENDDFTMRQVCRIHRVQGWSQAWPRQGQGHRQLPNADLPARIPRPSSTIGRLPPRHRPHVMPTLPPLPVRRQRSNGWRNIKQPLRRWRRSWHRTPSSASSILPWAQKSWLTPHA